MLFVTPHLSRLFYQSYYWMKAYFIRKNAVIITIVGVFTGLFSLQAHADCKFSPNDARSILQCAEKGDISAQYELGYRYLHGIGFAQSPTEAMRWYLQSAKAGSVAAQYVLAYLYQRGLGIRRSEHDAVIWYRYAAETGKTDAQYNLATLLITGRDIQKHPEEALPWYKKAANRGHIKATNNLAYLYHLGEGTPVNPTEAYRLYTRAAEKGLPESQYNLALLGLSFPQLPNIDSKMWLERAARQGFSPAMTRLGQWYAEQAPADYASAYYWLSLAAAFGNVKAKIGKEIVIPLLSETDIQRITEQIRQFKPKPITN